jgi:regulator of protease activity HflC (stomatin/prohibitin superfamily)
VSTYLKRVGLAKLAALAGAAALAWLAWEWVVCRTEVPAGQFLVRVHLWGKDLPEGEILAPDESYKGVMAEALPEGRYFLNPLVWTYERYPIVHVPPGKCLVLTRKYGKEIPADQRLRGDFLAGPEERGVVAEVLKPGNHRINPYAYENEVVNAVEVRAEEVGVHTLKVGKDPRDLRRDPGRSPYVVPEGYRGVQDKPLSNGTYYLNPYVEQVVPVDVRSHRVEFTDIEFPSRDGFSLTPHVFVTYKVVPAMAPELFVTLTDTGRLNQADGTKQEQADNQILQKVVLPLIRGYVRIEGSKFDARDFVSAVVSPGEAPAVNPRERLQQEVLEKVTPRCQKVGVTIESIVIDRMEVPPELRSVVAEREQARVTREKNLETIGQYKEQQELRAREALKQQEEEKVAAGTRLVKARRLAEQRKDVEESKLKQDLANAKLRLDAARAQAKATLAAGKAEADVITLKNEAEVAGLRTAVQGFPSAEQYAQYQVMLKLAPALGEVFASDGSEFARLFTAYLAPPAKTANPPASGGGTRAAAAAPAK